MTPLARVRRGLLVLAALSCAGITVELVLARHWTDLEQLVAWVTLALVVTALVVAWRGIAGSGRRTVVVAMALVAAGSVFGIGAHVAANHEAGPLDAQYGDQWDAMTPAAQWWAAATQRVGPSPPLVPAILLQAAALVGLAAMASESAPFR